MIPIDEFAKSKNLTTDQVLEGIKAGVYLSEYQRNRLFVAEKHSASSTGAGPSNPPHSPASTQATSASSFFDKTLKIQ